MTHWLDLVVLAIDYQVSILIANSRYSYLVLQLNLTCWKHRIWKIKGNTEEKYTIIPYNFFFLEI